MAIRIGLLIEEYNSLIMQGHEIYQKVGDAIIHEPIFAELEKRILEIDEILSLDTIAKKQKKIRKIRGFISKNKNNILNLHNCKCEVCDFNFKHSLIIHHNIPLSEGGDNSLNNLSVLCPTCHHLVHYLRSNQENEKNKGGLSEWAEEYLPINRIKKLYRIAYSYYYKEDINE